MPSESEGVHVLGAMQGGLGADHPAVPCRSLTSAAMPQVFLIVNQTCTGRSLLIARVRIDAHTRGAIGITGAPAVPIHSLFQCLALTFSISLTVAIVNHTDRGRATAGRHGAVVRAGGVARHPPHRCRAANCPRY